MRRHPPTSGRWPKSAESKLRRVSVTQDRSVSAGEDLARAFTLPASAYLDEAVFEHERDRIFARTWQLVARADELARVGDLIPYARRHGLRMITVAELTAMAPAARKGRTS